MLTGVGKEVTEKTHTQRKTCFCMPSGSCTGFLNTDVYKVVTKRKQMENLCEAAPPLSYIIMQ